MKEFVPKIFDVMKTYSKGQLVKDVVAGIIVAIIALPLSIALALASGVSPEQGIYTAIFAGFVISFLGGSRVQIAGPTAAFATIVAGIVARNGMDGLITATIMAGIILVISLYVNITSAIECRQNEARTAAVLEKLQNAIDEKTTGLGDKSEYYNYADMIDRARDTFPEEDIYYKLQTTEDYVTIIVTTKKKQNVCFDRYVPVQGSIGDEDTEYKLEIAMVSDAMQPDDILHNYTGILKIK